MGWLSDFADDVLGFDPNGGGIYDAVADVAKYTPWGLNYEYVVKPGLDWLAGAVTPDIPSFGSSARDTSILANVSSNVAKIPIIYGTRRVGGIRVFHGVSGTANEHYWRVFALSEGEIAGIDDVYLDDVISTDTKFGSTVQITKYVGTDAQTADAGLIAAFPSLWTSSHRLQGAAYIIVRLTFNPDVYSRVPVVTVNVRGKKVLDTRDALIKFSSNPALCVYDYLTNARYGKRLATSLLDTVAFNAAANDCDALISAYTAGPNITTFECNAVVDTGQDIKRNVEELLTSCRGFLPYTGGLYKLIIDKDTPSVMTMTADNIIGGWSIQSASKRTRQNRVKAKFVNPGKDWQPDYAITDSSTLRTQDAGLLLEAELQFPFETSYYRALYHTEVAMKKSRQGLTCSFTASPEALKIEIGDIIAITHETPGWTAKKFRVANLTLRVDGLVALTCSEHEATAYDRAVPVEAAAPADTNLPDPRVVDAPTALTPYSGTSELIQGLDGTIISRIRAVWPVSPSIYVIGSELEYKASSSAVWLPAAQTSARADVTAYIAPVKDGEAYDIRVRYLNAMGFYSVYWVTSNYIAIGKTEPPAPVTNFLVRRQSDGTREFTWDYASPSLDHAGFHIRYKLGAGQIWDNMVALYSDLIVSSPYETNQLAAGTYTFAIASVDTTGNVSTPIYIETTLGDPRLAGVIAAEYPRQTNWPGTKTDCWRDTVNNILISRDTKTWADSFPSWAAWTSWARTPVSTIIYEHPVIDVGVITPFTPLITAVAVGSQNIQISTSNDNVTYSVWSAPALVTARYIKVRVTLTGGLLLSLVDFVILLSTAVKDENIEDKNTSTLVGVYRIGVGDIRIPITKAYSVIRQVNVTLQNVGPGWSWEQIDKSISPGPRIKIYNASNVLADAVCDFYVKGL